MANVDPGGCYARFTDDLDSRGGQKHKLRKTFVYPTKGHPDLLTICTVDDKYNADYRPTRLSIEDALSLRAAIDQFLKDQANPDNRADIVPDWESPLGTSTTTINAGSEPATIERPDSNEPIVVTTFEEFSKL